MGIADATRPISHDPEVHAQLIALGASPPQPAPHPHPDAFEVLPKNWPAVVTWLDCETQWRAVSVPSGLLWLGLDYSGVDVVLRRNGAPDGAFADLQLMERAALETFRETRP